MNNEIARYSEETFESIKHVDEYGYEFWYARELQRVLEYTQWRRFADAIERAKLACSNSGYSASEHFCRRRQIIADAPRRSPHSGRLHAFPLCLLPDRYEWRPAQGGHRSWTDLLRRKDAPAGVDRPLR